jgi:hypothetical protein
MGVFVYWVLHSPVYLSSGLVPAKWATVKGPVDDDLLAHEGLAVHVLDGVLGFGLGEILHQRIALHDHCIHTEVEEQISRERERERERETYRQG